MGGAGAGGLHAAAAGELAHPDGAGAVLCVRWAPGGQFCLTGTSDRVVRLWNPRSGLLVKAYTALGAEVRDTCAAPDRGSIAACGGDRQVALFDVPSASVLRRFPGHEARGVNAVVFAGPSGAVLVSGGYDRAVRVWDCRSRSAAPVQSLTGFGDSVTSVVADGAEIVAGSVDGTARTFDARLGRCAVDTLGPAVSCVRLSPDAKGLLAGCMGGRVALLDRRSGCPLAEYRGHVQDSCKLDCDLTDTGAHVMSGSEDGRVLYWDLAGGAPALEFRAHRGAVCSLAWHPEGEMLLTASPDGNCLAWRGSAS